jgi:hypothetical protein
LHAVSRNADPATAVIGLLYDIERNAFLPRSTMLPERAGDRVSDEAREINLADALDDVSRYYTYAIADDPTLLAD